MQEPERPTKKMSGQPWRRRLAIGAVALTAILAGGVFALVASGRDDARPLAAEASPTPTATVQTPTPTATPSASPVPAATHAQTPEPSAPSGSPQPSPPPSVEWAIDAVVEVTVAGLRLRETPGLDGISLGTLASGSLSLVVDGPRAADGYEWYLLSGLGLPPYSGCAGPPQTDPWECPGWLGWVAAAGPDGEEWLTSTRLDCADPSGPLWDFTFQPRYLYIACYGSEPVTLRGWLVVSPGMPLDDPCPDVQQQLRWLACPGSMFQLVPESDAEMGLEMALGPDARLPGESGLLEVVGHYDDPAAANCDHGERPEVSVLWCRSQFVVESGRIVSGP